MNRKQKGFTLLELLLAMLSAAAIGAGIVVLVTQVFIIPNHNTARMTAVMQVDNAVDAITRDVMQAQTITPSGTAGFPLTFAWTDYGTSNNYSVTYTINSTTKTLTRSLNNGMATVVASNIDSTTNCILNANTLTLNITSTVTGPKPASETRQVQIVRRPT